jgi:type IV secretion system protein VirB5
MSFGKTTSSYGNGKPVQPETPYSRAARAWDDRIGSARVQARNWRYMAFASMAGMLLFGIGFVHLAGKKQVATYVVEVDKFGMPGRITLASEPYRPEAAQVGYFVAELVRLVRERPLDPVVLRKQWTKAYQFIAGDAVSTMNQYAAADSGLDAIGNHVARTVEVSNVLQKSPGSYQVRWVETTYTNGIRRGQEQWTGLFQVALIPPKNEEDAFRNPLGAYVTSFNWSREFAAPVVPAADPGNRGSNAARPPRSPGAGGEANLNNAAASERR